MMKLSAMISYIQMRLKIKQICCKFNCMQEGEGQSKSGRRKRIKYSSRKNMSIKNFKKSTKM